MDYSDEQKRIVETLEAFFNTEMPESVQYDRLGGHASYRIYWRISLEEPPEDVDLVADDTSLLAMVLPDEDQFRGSEEGPDGPEVETDELPFIDVQNYLEEIGLPTPDVYYDDTENGVILLEDLGDTHFEDAVLDAAEGHGELEARKKRVEKLYREAIDTLVDLQQSSITTAASNNPQQHCIAFGRTFDSDEIRWELDHYLEWGLEAQYGSEEISPVREELNTEFDRLAQEVSSIPKSLAVRDYQSRNLMKKNDEWHLIDFQDAFLAPYVYDLVSLLRDSYVAPDPDQLDPLIEYYHNLGNEEHLPWCTENTNIWKHFFLQTIQRKLKDAGRFVYIEKEKGDPTFLQYYDRSIRFVREALDRISGFERLEEILVEVEPSMSKNM